MKRSARMEKIADINHGFENIAGASLTKSRVQHQQQENQLEQLKIYKGEYQNQLKNRLKDTITAREIQDYQFFFSSLDSAISQQENILKESAQQVETSQKNWMQKKQDHSKISRIAENLKVQEDAVNAKKEQAESDELNQILFAPDKPH